MLNRARCPRAWPHSGTTLPAGTGQQPGATNADLLSVIALQPVRQRQRRFTPLAAP
jgi:hypothetical protein